MCCCRALCETPNPAEEHAEIGDVAPLVKVTDFGLARRVHQTESLQLTQTNAAIGTPVYMSPEQCAAGEVTPASDIYSLGITLYEMLTGKPPFAGAPLEVISKHRFEPPPALKKQRPDLSEATLRLTERCLAKEPGERFLDASHLLEHIERLRRGEPSDLEQHPKLPEHNDRKVFRADFEWNLKSPPHALWPYVSNTERLNNAVGVPSVEYETTRDDTLGLRKFGTFALAGMTIRWEEHPFEWIEGQRLAVLRTFSQGPFRWFLSIVELEPTPDGGTCLHHRVRIDPRGIVGRGVAHLEVNIKGKPALNRVYPRIDRVVSGALDARSLPDHYLPPPKLSARLQRELDTRHEELVGQGGTPLVADRLCALLSKLPAQELSRIRPKQLAEDTGIDVESTVETCLRAVRLGLLELKWDVLCPTCRVSASVKDTLRDVRAHDQCEFCDVEFAVDFGKSIELIFRAHPQFREVDTRTYCIGGPEYAPHVVAQLRLAPGERIDVRTQLSTGRYFWRGPQLPYAIPVLVTANAPARAEIVFSVEQLGTLETVTVRSGAQSMTVTNDTTKPILVRLERTIHRADVMTAAETTNLPLYQELFPADTLRPGELVQLGSATFLAMLQPQLTALCRDFGDAAAYDLFVNVERMFCDVVQQHRGRPIGERAELFLATFDDPESAIEATLSLRKSMTLVSMADRLRPQLGLHCGEALITAREQGTDYFGYALQLTQQLAGAAEPGAMVLTEDVATHPRVAQLLWHRSIPVNVIYDANLDRHLHVISPTELDGPNE